MTYVQLRSFPGLFVGRREVVRAVPVEEGGRAAYRCGACESPMGAPESIADLRHVVLRCACGSFNQL